MNANANRVIDSMTIAGHEYKDVSVVFSAYHTKEPAIQLFWTDPDTGWEEPLATASVYLEGQPPAPGCVWIKNYSENEGMDAALVKAGVIELTGRTARAGWVTVPEGRIV